MHEQWLQAELDHPMCQQQADCHSANGATRSGQNQEFHDASSTVIRGMSPIRFESRIPKCPDQDNSILAWARFSCLGQIVDKLDSKAVACHSTEMVATAKLLRAARIALGLSLDELAAEAGIDRRTVSRVEGRGDDQRPLGSAIAVERALERKGIVFLKATANEGAGFRLPTEPPTRSAL
ncbi:helix-turn-helix domain-containing protein [Bosea rubneri]|uniref:Helix-turn-helix transcriptional regulator n=1 Tax=Bosea rubneri TaxID=3075434 RepID=A0ABU3SB99_9HYPH|nr:helix-turn-helix transcriptional regulator [Bosea sp. ZW T0_25]MDU0342063.1 helix-turn-helix transcriptional regulator [Bosea sp. ZW T0_25]